MMTIVSGIKFYLKLKMDDPTSPLLSWSLAQSCQGCNVSRPVLEGRKGTTHVRSDYTVLDSATRVFLMAFDNLFHVFIKTTQKKIF